jgi:hypothetical protein
MEVGFSGLDNLASSLTTLNKVTHPASEQGKADSPSYTPEAVTVFEAATLLDKLIALGRMNTGVTFRELV